MWEVLPEAACDRALCLHNKIIREALNKHLGYECGTEVSLSVCFACTKFLIVL